jgi:hypothetical protein
LDHNDEAELDCDVSVDLGNGTEGAVHDGATCDMNIDVNGGAEPDVCLRDASDSSSEANSDSSSEANSDEESNEPGDSCNNEVLIESKLLEPLYENANITVCGAYCVIMEFKRACNLSYRTIAMLLQLLQLLCPRDNNLPKSVYMFKGFFQKYTSPSQCLHFCPSCGMEFGEQQKQCANATCNRAEPNTLIQEKA